MIQETVLGVKRHNVDYHCCITVLFGSLLFFACRCPTQVYPDMPSIGRKAAWRERAPADEKDANSKWLSV
jgi:hypothetical protein